MRHYLLTLLLLLVPLVSPAQTLWDDVKSMTSGLTDKYKYTVPLTGRKYYMLVSDEELLQLSKVQYRSYIRSVSLSTDAKQTAMVRRVATRLSKAVAAFYRKCGRTEELKNFSWEFNLVKSKEVNAFCMPGGKIVVYEGILPVTRDENSLAIVLGHEIAHAIAKHSAEQMSKQMIQEYGFQIAMGMLALSGTSSGKMDVIQVASAIGLQLKNLRYSRQMETEADRIGLIIAAMAGYDPRAAVDFWKRMRQTSGNRSAHDWYSDHPSDSNRIKNVRSFMPEAMKYYNPK